MNKVKSTFDKEALQNTNSIEKHEKAIALAMERKDL
jgi:hypothetical protein